MKNKTQNRWRCVAATVVVLSGAVSGSTVSGQPLGRRIPYQGEISGASGPVTLSVDLYDAAIAGNRVWGAESHVVSPDSLGRFVVVLGSTGLDIDANGVPDLDELEPTPLFVEATIDDGMVVTVLAPRLELLPAFHASSTGALTTPADLDALATAISERLAPAGLVVPWPLDDGAVPPGWLLCDDSEYLVSDDPELASLLLPTFGGTTPERFRVPDYRGRFLRGTNLDASPTRDPSASLRNPMFILPTSANGNVAGSIQFRATRLPRFTPFDPSQNGVHTHTYTTYDKFIFGTTPGPVGLWASSGTTRETVPSRGSHFHFLSPFTGFSGGDAETRPKNAAVNFIIKH